MSGKRYLPVLTVVENQKGVVDVDTVKGCAPGMHAHPGGGCYGECYAAKTAARYGIDFASSVSRKITDAKHLDRLMKAIGKNTATWYRVGTSGDPSHDWDNTIAVLLALEPTGKTPVIVIKHWKVLSGDHVRELKRLGAVVNTSTSALDSDAEIEHRIGQLERLRRECVPSVCRVVTCRFGDTEWGRDRKECQAVLLSLVPVIDNPLRASRQNPRAMSGDILLERRGESTGGGGKLISLHSESVYLGTCLACPDQCGVAR